MQIKGEGVAAQLARAERSRTIPPLWVVAGDEALLALEAQDAIRSAARSLGFAERTVLHMDSRSDWSKLAEAAQSLSLFAARTIIEVRLSTGKPGLAGAAALEAHAANPSEDVLTLIALPSLDWRSRKTRWVSALEGTGVWVDIEPIERSRLPAWIGQRLGRQGQSTSPEGLEFIADRVEGNLLAARQEIAKLELLYPAGELGIEQVRDAVLDVARFDLFQLPVAILCGDTSRVARTMEGLRAEGEPIPLVLWAITEDLRKLVRIKGQVDRGRPFASVARENQIWSSRESQFASAVQRLDSDTLDAALAHAGEIDRLSKGLRAPQADSDAWLELTDLALSLAQ